MFSRTCTTNPSSNAPGHRWRAIVPIVLAALLSATATEVAAQTLDFRGFQERHDRVEREYERTQEVWKEVHDRVAQSNLPALRTLVDQARVIQGRAWDELVAARESFDGPGVGDRIANRHLQNSLSLTLRARDLTSRAARQLREDLSQEENARRTLERARQRFERLTGGDDRLRAQAAELIDRAEMQWRDGRFEQALRLAQNAVSVLETIEERRGDEPDPARVVEALRRAEQRYARAAEAEAPRRRLGVVRRLLDQAAEALRAERTREAAQRIVSARRALDDIEASVRDRGNRTERALDRLDAQIERIRDRFGARLDTTGERLLRQAGDARDRARRALRDGDEQRAQQQIRAAADLLARLKRHAGDGR